MADDDVLFRVSFQDDSGGDDSGKGGSKQPKNPFSGIKPLTKQDIKDLFSSFPPMKGIKEVFESLAEIDADFLGSGLKKEISRSITDLFRDLPGLGKSEEFDSSLAVGMEQSFKKLQTTLQEFDSSIVGFLPEDFEAGIDAFFAAIKEDTDAIEAQKKAFEDLLEAQNDSFESLFKDIGGTIAKFTKWGGYIATGITALSGFVVGLHLADAVLKEVFKNLGEFAATFKVAQAEVNRDLILQQLENSRRLDRQLAANERIRGELTSELNQFTVELFDLLDPIVRFLVVAVTLIMKVLNSILATLNFLKDLPSNVFSLLGGIANLLNPMAEDARENIRERDKKKFDDIAIGLGSANDLFNMGNVDLTANDLPPGLREDVVEHPFTAEDVPQQGPAGGWGGGAPFGGGGF